MSIPQAVTSKDGIELQHFLGDEWVKVLNSLSYGEIPESFPDEKAIDDIGFDLNDIGRVFRGEDFACNLSGMEKRFTLKSIVNTYGMFGYISKQGARFLAERLKGKTVIDPFAGRGWAAKALREQGVKVIAGDIEVSKKDCVSHVSQFDAEELILRKGHRADVLLLNWAPYDNTCDFRAARAWGSEREIIFYGELGMCCGSERFYQSYRVDERISEFPDLNCAVLRRLMLYSGRIEL